MNEVYLTTAYLAPVHYYSKLFHAKKAVIERYDHYLKQTYRNRCTIAGANGPLALSIPIVKPDNPKTFSSEIRISDHGNWQHLHWHAIRSAYSSSPFFEYYADDFAPFYCKKQAWLFDFNEELRQLVCRLLEIEPAVSFSTGYAETLLTADFREAIHPKRNFKQADPSFTPAAYYQVFAAKYGFVENLSIVDLLFNMGNEARLVLQTSHKDESR